ncbi:MAG TPA: YdcF family protein [Candidatus Eremiobacteraceae bacterium]|nr:YdcF family protein [Candidatus Eremiobacteraceae bacterium]
MNRGIAKRAWILTGILLCVLLAGLAAKAGSFLLVDAPQRSDVVLVLAGETKQRPQLALQLLSRGYGRTILLDVPIDSTIYEFTQIQLAQKYISDLPQPASVSICPIHGLSTKDESKDVENCLAQEGVKRVLIVTSDFHTRRALSVFRRELPQYEYSVAAAHDEAQFGVRWWTHRQWAKTFVDEWLRMIWWKMVDQWRPVSG